jgi:serine/threonine protein kinase
LYLYTFYLSIVVFKVINKETNIAYAAKQINKSKLSPEDEIGLQQEVEILQTLNHDHIVKFIDFFSEQEYYYLVLELLEGGELFDRIVQKSCYTEREARDLVFILLNAIKYCHDNNVVHRDLKPENLLMSTQTDDSNVKIADFGFAKRARGFSLLTQCGSPGLDIIIF